MDSAKCRKQVPAAVWDVQIGGLSLPSPPLLPLPFPCDRVGIFRDPFAITSDRAAAPPLSVAMGAGSQSYCSAGVGGAARCGRRQPLCERSRRPAARAPVTAIDEAAARLLAMLGAILATCALNLRPVAQPRAAHAPQLARSAVAAVAPWLPAAAFADDVGALADGALVDGGAALPAAAAAASAAAPPAEISITDTIADLFVYGLLAGAAALTLYSLYVTIDESKDKWQGFDKPQEEEYDEPEEVYTGGKTSFRKGAIYDPAADEWTYPEPEERPAPMREPALMKADDGNRYSRRDAKRAARKGKKKGKR